MPLHSSLTGAITLFFNWCYYTHCTALISDLAVPNVFAGLKDCLDTHLSPFTHQVSLSSDYKSLSSAAPFSHHLPSPSSFSHHLSHLSNILWQLSQAINPQTADQGFRLVALGAPAFHTVSLNSKTCNCLYVCSCILKYMYMFICFNACLYVC